MAETILVTGGAGFIGSHIAEAAVERGDRVRVLDNLCTGNRDNLRAVQNDVEFYEADICNEAAVRQALQGVDVVFHHAALASVPLSVERPLEVNQACVTGTLMVLNEARRAGVRRLVYAASSSCYGDLPYSANREKDLPKPLSPYAVAKLAGEYYANAFYQTYGLETVCLRYFNVFGPRQDPDSPYSAVIPIFLKRILSGERPIIYGDGLQSRDFTYVADIVNGNFLAASVDASQVAGRSFNLAAGKSTSLLTLLEMLQRYLGTSVEPIFERPRPGDIRDSMADISETMRCLGYEPQVSFEQGLERSIEYYRSLNLSPSS